MEALNSRSDCRETLRDAMRKFGQAHVARDSLTRYNVKMAVPFLSL
jgi:hypothetical protein